MAWKCVANACGVRAGQWSTAFEFVSTYAHPRFESENKWNLRFIKYCFNYYFSLYVVSCFSRLKLWKTTFWRQMEYLRLNFIMHLIKEKRRIGFYFISWNLRFFFNIGLLTYCKAFVALSPTKPRWRYLKLSLDYFVNIIHNWPQKKLSLVMSCNVIS